MACQKVRSSSSSRKLALLLLHTGVVLLVLALPVGGEAGRTDPMPDTSTFTDVEESSDVSSLDMDSFCKGMPMAMFMDGFHRSLGSRAKHQRCLLYFVSGWTLTDEGKFKGAVIYSFLLGLLMEVLSAVRGAAAHYLRKPVLMRILCLTVIYGIQALLGYLLMFLAMTFSVEILVAAVVGLCVGNLALFRYEDFQPPRKRRDQAANQVDGQLREPLLSQG